MKVKLEFYRNGEYNGRCIVTKEASDPKFYNESTFMHHVKTALNEQGQDLIKKVISKDGHMVGDNYGPYYLRDRKGRFGIWDHNYCLRAVEKVFNESGEVRLDVDDLRNGE